MDVNKRYIFQVQTTNRSSYALQIIFVNFIYTLRAKQNHTNENLLNFFFILSVVELYQIKTLFGITFFNNSRTGSMLTKKLQLQISRVQICVCRLCTMTHLDIHFDMIPLTAVVAIYKFTSKRGHTINFLSVLFECVDLTVDHGVIYKLYSKC